jgi:hypothetical protein
MRLPRQLHALYPLLASLLVLMVIAGTDYIRVVYSGQMSPESLIEAGNYAAQTVTTIGYGNWKPHWLEEKDLRVLTMKLHSIPFMLFGAALFGATIGIAANLISRL